MRIAVIGVSGLLGSALMRLWNQTGSQDDLIPLDYPEFDICTRLFVLDSLESIRPAVILNAAGVNLIDFLEPRANTARTIHVQGTANIREGARRTGALLVQFGCAEVFYHDRPDGPANQETDEPEPCSIYAKTKLESERAASEYERHLIIRTSSLFGKEGTRSSGNLVSSLLNLFRRTRNFKVIDDLQTSPTWTDDLVPAVKELVQRDARGLYHLAAAGRATPFQVADHLLARCGLKSHEALPISMAEYGHKAPHSHNTVLNSDKYHSEQFGVTIPDWQEEINRFLKSRETGI